MDNINSSSSAIRNTFLEYFVSNGHMKLPSSPLVPDDPSLLFTNSGMVPFKRVFLNQEKPRSPRVTTSQCAVRAGGKHNDLENVGFTSRHHTFFEMLGNFSFGDYFKEEAISYAWELVNKEFEIPKDRLWITVFQDDEEAFNLWSRKIGVAKDRIIRLGEDSNFWQMAELGPCGPCSEIFYDHGDKVWGGPPGSDDEDGDRYVEIWNLVFMQFERLKNGSLKKLPKPCVDTGMGLERISAVIQGVHNNYDTDLFTPIISVVKNMINISANFSDIDSSCRVISDHIRASVFLIIDGVVPSNEAHGYVLRRIIRRALRHGYKLGIELPFFHKLVKEVINIMKDGYPQLVSKQSFIENTLLFEENQFSKTLSYGIELLGQYFNKSDNRIIDGATAFKLYDTFGFPVDLTVNIANENKFSVDMDSFDKHMSNQRENSRKNQSFQDVGNIDLESDKVTEFIGYTADNCEAEVLVLFEKLDDENRYKKVDEIRSEGIIILDITPFYSEAGGQVADTGYISSGDITFIVQDVQKQGSQILHYGYIKDYNGCIKSKYKVKAQIDCLKRNDICKNHTATHLLHASLISVLGKHVSQKGSLVNNEHLRFDFSHPKALSKDEIYKIVDIVNSQINKEVDVLTDEMKFDDAKKIGAKALFNEKYKEEVRVLFIPSDKLSKEFFSIELCGGTHVKNTRDLMSFHILSEGAVASGIRRIEAITGKALIQYYKNSWSKLEKIKSILSIQQDKVLMNKVEKIKKDYDKLQKEITNLKIKNIKYQIPSIVSKSKNINKFNLLVHELEQNIDIKVIKSLLDSLRDNLKNGIIVLVQPLSEGYGANVICGVGLYVSKSFEAKDILNMIIEKAGGRGGGKDNFAQGGIKDITKLGDAINYIEKELL